jgi:hypothetical protein
LKKRHLLLPCLLVASAFALVACGSSSSSGSSDEVQIEEAIQTATKPEPADCTKFETQAFVEQSSDKTGRAAIKSCEKEAEEPTNAAESVTTTNIEVNGSKATADAAFVGSGFDGQTLTVALLKEGGQWKLDKVSGFAKLDKAALEKTFEKEFEASGELNKTQISCIVDGIGKASQPEIEELLLSGSSKAFVELAERCAQ